MRCPKCKDFGFYVKTNADGTREGITCKCHVEGVILEQDKEDYSPLLRGHTISEMTPKDKRN